MIATRCTECDEPDCPSIIVCPQCGIGEHGFAAQTHVADHGMCWNCLQQWKMGEHFGMDEEEPNED